MTETFTYRYGGASVLAMAGRPELALSTWAPDRDRADADGAGGAGLFVDGWVVRADVVAAGLLAVAGVAGSRYYEPPNMIARRIAAADPVVTYDGAWLRFESLSQCAGVHARFDVDAAGLDLVQAATGTTNVDVNPPLAAALALVGPSEPMRLQVGRDRLVVELLSGPRVEKKVPLPDRWVRGLGESQVQVRAMEPRIDLQGPLIRSLAHDLPRAGRRAVHVEGAPRGLRLSSRPGRSSVALSGPDRLRALLPLLRLAERLVVHAPAAGDGGPTASAWELWLPSGRLTLTVSAEPSRGFSGEGGLLASLAVAAPDDPAAALDALAARPLSSVADVARHAGLPVDGAARALDVLAASGRVGYDAGWQGFFQRHLPFGAALERLNPRLAASQVLLDAAAVSFDGGDGRRAVVSSGDHHQVVLLGPAGGVDGASCSCPWYARHTGGRGPCKHVLAAARAYRRQASGG